MPLDLTRQWTELPIAVIDFETTGPDPETAQPVEVAAVRFENGKAVDQFSSLVDPGCPIPEEATKIHGITDEMVKGKPPLAEVGTQLAQVAMDAIPCAFNAPFDRRILHRIITGTDVPAFDPSVTWLDVYVVVASPRVDKYVSGSGRLKLANVCKRWDIELNDAHRALGDATATGMLLFRLLEREAIKACPLGKLLEHVERMREEQQMDWAQFHKRLLAEERVIWRQYACAALMGNCMTPADAADALLAAEKERYVKGGR